MKRADLQFHFSGLNLGKIENRINQIQQMPPAGKHILGVALLLLIERSKSLIAENFRKSDDRVQRRPQLMADIGEKLAFSSVRRFRRLFAPHQGGRGAGALGRVNTDAEHPGDATPRIPLRHIARFKDQIAQRDGSGECLARQRAVNVI